MSDQTTNWDLPWPELGDNANIETAVKPLADRLETILNMFGTGTLTAAAFRDALGVEIGADVQAHDVDLDAIAALVSAANKLPYATGAGAWSLADLTAAGRALLDDADAAAQRATLGIQQKRVSGQSVSAFGVTDVTLTWPTAFGDTNYTATVALQFTDNNSEANPVARITSKTASAIVVRIYQYFNAAVSSITVHGIAIHD